MRRTTLWLWLTGGVLGVATIVVFGGWWALRQWPEVVGPRLPPSLAYAIADWGPEESRAAHHCFRSISEYRDVHPMTTAQADACNAVLCAELRGSREQKLAVLGFIGGSDSGFVDASPERDALVFALTTSPDPELRRAARSCWLRDGPDLLKVLRWLPQPDDDDRSPVSPDGWVCGPAAAIAWRIEILLSVGYDHITPNRFRNLSKDLLDRLVAHQRQDGRFAEDPRDHAIALLAVADAHSMTNDTDLKPVVERGLRALADHPRLERLWFDDTTCACLSAWAYRTSVLGGIEDATVARALSDGLDAWLSATDESGTPPWFSRGAPVPATAGERWGIMIIGQRGMLRDPPTPSAVPAWIADPTDSTPLGRYFIRFSSLFPGGQPWQDAFNERTGTLFTTRTITPDHQPPEGAWPTDGRVSGSWQTVFALLELVQRQPRYMPPAPP